MRISDWSSDGCSSDRGDSLVDAEGRVLGSADQAASLPAPLVRVTGVEGSTEPGDHLPASSRGVLAVASALSVSAPGAVAELDASGDELWARLSAGGDVRSEEHTSELQSLMRISYAVFCLKKKKKRYKTDTTGKEQTSH